MGSPSKFTYDYFRTEAPNIAIGMLGMKTVVGTGRNNHSFTWFGFGTLKASNIRLLHYPGLTL